MVGRQDAGDDQPLVVLVLAQGKLQIGGGQLRLSGLDANPNRHQPVAQLIQGGRNGGRGGAGVRHSLDHGVGDLRNAVPALLQGHGNAGHGDHLARPDGGHLIRIVAAVQKGQNASGAVLQIHVLPAAVGDHAGEARICRRKTKREPCQYQQRCQQDPDPLHTRLHRKRIHTLCRQYIPCFETIQQVREKGRVFFSPLSSSVTCDRIQP